MTTFFTRDDSGMGLVEIMISLGIMSVALLAIGSVMTFGNSSAKNVRGRIEAGDLVREIRLILGNPDRCAQIFSGVAVSSNPSLNSSVGTAVTIPLDEGSKAISKSHSSESALGAGRTYNQLNINRLNLRVGPKLSLNQYVASLILEVAPLAPRVPTSEAAAQSTLRREIPLILNVHPKTHQILGCNARSNLSEFSQSEGNQLCLMVSSAGNFHDPKIWDLGADSCVDTVETKTVYGTETRANCERGWTPVSTSASSCTYTFAADSQPVSWTAQYDNGTSVTAGPPPVATYLVTASGGANFCGCIPAVGVSGTRCGIICKQ